MRTVGAIALLGGDDDDDHRAAIVDALSQRGLQSVEAADGRSAIDYLINHPEPRIILLDLMMPGLSGWDVLHVLRPYYRLCRIPVIVISGEEAWVQVPASNVVGRLRKPYHLAELFALLDQHLVNGKSGAA